MKLNSDETKNYTQFTMRIENDLYKTIKHSAQKFKRSIAKEIEYSLAEYYKNLRA